MNKYFQIKSIISCLKHSHKKLLKFSLTAVFILFALCLPKPILAEWQVNIGGNETTPDRFILVDKKNQILTILEQHSPLATVATYPCTTGQSDGDKQVQGDLKTPEGVYFINKKLNSGLDFEEYGGIAYTLNYPNPVDKLRNKSGYGIWIHGRGREIQPKETRGCVALNLDVIKSIDNILVPGLPVTLAHETVTMPVAKEEDIQIAKALKDKVNAWANAWSKRSKDLFTFYEPDSYSISTESFNYFKQNKENIFKNIPWINTIIGEVKILPGPGYWVTWFEQLYKAPNLTSEGIRRLYWQETEDGDLRIVGMEWEEQNTGISALYLENITPKIATFIEKWRLAWEKGDLNTYMSCYLPNAKQGTRSGANSIREQKKNLWSKIKPRKVIFDGLRIELDQDGIKADMQQTFQDSTGFTDKGIKTIILKPMNNDWAIIQEDWNAIN